jgi:hypothetical protein
MNANQRRKLRRRLGRTDGSGSQHRFVGHWSDLAEVPESETHRLEIEVENCNGWIKDKRNPDAFGHYLSTHTFYGSNYLRSTRLLRSCGFNVTLANWDMPNVKDVATCATSNPQRKD